MDAESLIVGIVHDYTHLHTETFAELNQPQKNGEP